MKKMIRPLFTLLSLALLLSASLQIISLQHASALGIQPDTNPQLADAWPSPLSSIRQNARNEYDMTQSLMIASNHGNVGRIDVGLYWPGAAGTRQANIQEVTGHICDIHNSSQLAWGNTYLQVYFDGALAANITGKKLCSIRPASNGFYGLYNVNPTYDPGTGLLKSVMSIRFTNTATIYDGGSSQQFNFKAQAVGGYAANVYASSDAGGRNNAVAGKFSGSGGAIRQVFPFGLACNAGSSSNAAVTLSDADNHGKATSLATNFFVAKVNADGTYTPLRTDQYLTRNGAPAIDETGIAPQPGGPSVVDYSYNAGQGYGGDAPVFIPGDYNNKGGRTTVYIGNLPSLGVDDTAHYALIVNNIDTNGGAASHTNNYIYVGTPGDGIFGSQNFQCPPAHVGTTTTVSPPPEGLFTGGQVSLTPNLIRVDGNATVNNYRVDYWYSGTDSAAQAVPASATKLATRSGAFGASYTGAPYVITTLQKLDPDTRFLCARTWVADTVGAKVGPNTFMSYQTISCTKFEDYQPYTRVYGGDVEAGNGPSSNQICTPVTPARISGWNNGAVSGNNYNGAGSQFGAQAMDVIRGFVSAQGNSGSNPARGSGLSFANVDVGGEYYGGNFGASSGCSDYTKNLPADTDRRTSATNDALYQSGAVTVGTGVHKTVYVEGNAYIDNNILYTDGYSLANIPSYKLVVTGGNIYVGANVTELDGIYVAQPSPTTGAGGNIYTCATTSPSLLPVSSGRIYFDCNKQLKIYGSFVAKKVYFLRTFGTIGKAGTDNAMGNPGSPNAAEQFVYSPETWLGQTDTDNSGLGKIQAITSLPPTISGN